MKRVLLVLLLSLFMTGQAVAVMQLVIIRYSQKEELENLLTNPRLDVLKIKLGSGVECLTDDSEISSLKKLGFSMDVIIDDVIVYNRKIRANYKTGPMGPYFSYSEAVAEMNSLHVQYPSLVSAPESLGAGWENHAVWAFKVSSSPMMDNGKPGVIYTGMHHAWEPIGVTITLGLARYLCQNYYVDPEIKTLLDNRQIWFIPIINPDGYVFIENNPDSSWRKNRRNNGDGSYGVDLNRNYPYMWGYDNIGSSPITSAETYRGPSAGSEPEVQAVMALATREGYFRTALNYHSCGNLWMHPWGHTTTPTPDSALFGDLARECITYNGYTWGQSSVILYHVNGDAKDWWYGDMGCYPFTPEVGEGQWQPDTSIIVGQFNENLMPNILTAQAAGVYPAPTGKTLVAGGDGDTLPEPGELLNLSIEVKNKAMDVVAGGVVGHLSSRDPYIEIKQAARSYGDIDPRELKQETVPFVIDIDSFCPGSHRAVLGLNLVDNGGTVYFGQVSLNMVGPMDTIFADSAENGVAGWTHSDSSDLWHITTHSNHTPSNSWYCGNEGTWQYNNDMNCRLVSEPITANKYFKLSFWHRYQTEIDWDFCYVDISTDNGATWAQAGPRFNGTAGWSQHSIDLNAFSGTIRLGFRFNSDEFDGTDEGWYIDDIVVTGDTSGSHPPGSPVAVSPAGGVEVSDSLPWLTVANAADPNGDTLSYGFNIYSDSLLTSIYTQGKNVASGSGTTAWQLNKALIPGHYWWRAYADDGQERGLFCDKANFAYDPDGVQGYPDARSLPGTYSMGQAFPNPSPGRAEIKYQLPRSGAVEIKIYNVSGQLVRVLEAGPKPAGYHAVRWDGRDEQGLNVGSGIYFCKMLTAGFSATQRLTVIR